MNVSLPPEFERLIAEQVASGRYASASELVRESLRLLFDTGAKRAQRIEHLQAEIVMGLEQLDRGEGIPGEHVFDEVTALLEARRRA